MNLSRTAKYGEDIGAPVSKLTSPIAGESWTRDSVADLINRVVFYVLLALIVVVAIPYGTVTPGWEAVFECSVFGLGFLWIIQGLLSRSWRINAVPLLLPLLALVVLAFFQTITLRGQGPVSADPYETRLFIYKLLALITAGQLLLHYTSSPRRLRVLIHVLIGVGLMSALFGLVRQVSQSSSAGFVLHSLKSGVGYGQFINNNHFAFLMEMVLGLVLGLVIGGALPRARTFPYLAAALLVWTALVLSNSRGAILSMLCLLLFIGLFFTGLHSRRLMAERTSGTQGWPLQVINSVVSRTLLTVMLIVLVALGTLWVGGDALKLHLESASADFSEKDTEGLEATNRAVFWQATWRLIKAQPIAGVGFGGYWVAIAEYDHASGNRVPQQAHNDYLELLASGGVLGVMIWAWFVFALIKRALQQLRSADAFRRAAIGGALAGIFAVAVHSLGDFGLHITINALVFTALVVIATSQAQVVGSGESHGR